jgi:hypothetical protein
MADDKKVSQQFLAWEHQLKRLQEKVENACRYQGLRQDVLKSQRSTINWWRICNTSI